MGLGNNVFRYIFTLRNNATSAIDVLGLAAASVENKMENYNGRTVPPGSVPW